MAHKLSDEQKKAIESRDRDLLVSAAAGAGKTSVLTARIISLVTDEKKPVDIDRILVVTFTRAAAGEMRERIANELAAKLKENPGDANLIRQSVLLHSADISTIDSFCTRVIKNYFQNADLDPAFRVGEEGELRLLKSDCLDALLEEEYQEGREEFINLRETYFDKERTLKETILNVYEMSISMPYPERWLNEWAGKLYEKSEEAEVEKELEFLRPFGDELAGLAEKFGEKYSDAKKEKGLVDFSDLEHFTLKILWKDDGNGGYVRTSAAQELARHYKEVMTDEYQDSNAVQEMILSAISGEAFGGHDRFMVGDVKQSIYGFRQADPSIFLKKYDTYGTAEGTERIDLHENFRSRETVINTVNRAFKRLMIPELGGIAYDERAALVYGAKDIYTEPAEEGAYDTEIYVLDEKDPDFDGFSEKEKKNAEAYLAAKRILELEGTLRVYDAAEKKLRPSRMGDFAVLLRKNDECESFRRVFQEMGIPARTESRSGFFSSAEVVTVLNYLRILDNPLQDVPFAGVCFSPIAGFSSSEMAAIRVFSPGESWYGACVKYSREGDNAALKEKLSSFLSMYEALRESVSGRPVHRIIEDILDLTDYRFFASGMPSGEQRSVNLDFLIQKAKDFEGTSYNGLFNFVRYIEKLHKEEEDYGEADTAPDDGGSVRIMTIHKSKGLEFPVVLLCCAANDFRLNSDTVALHKDFGPGFGITDRRRMVKKNNPAYKKLVTNKIKEDEIAEEMRLLYVAMTRAREKLIITGKFKNLSKDVKECLDAGAGGAGPLPAEAILKNKSFMKWIIMALGNTSCTDGLKSLAGIKTGGSENVFGIRLYVETAGNAGVKAAGEGLKGRKSAREIFSGDTDAETDELLSEIREFTYDKPFLSDMPEKLSVSELKRMGEKADDEEGGGELFEEERVIPYIPAFIEKETEKEEAPTGAARGTIYHFVFENLDYSRFAPCEEAGDYDKEAETQIKAFVDAGKLTFEEAAAVRVKDISRFLLSPLGKRMTAADKRGELKREQPFTSRLPASDVNPEWDKEEYILIQGIIDAYFYEGGNIILVDYKTDYVKDPEGADLLDKYGRQLYYYKAALQAATLKNVTETYLYSTRLGKAVKCPV